MAVFAGFTSLILLGLVAPSSCSLQHSCMVSWLTEMGIPPEAAEAYASSERFSSNRVNVNALLAANRGLLDYLGLTTEHQELLEACKSRPGHCAPKRCVRDSDCMYVADANDFRCCTTGGRSGQQQHCPASLQFNTTGDRGSGLDPDRFNCSPRPRCDCEEKLNKTVSRLKKRHKNNRSKLRSKLADMEKELKEVTQKLKYQTARTEELWAKLTRQDLMRRQSRRIRQEKQRVAQCELERKESLRLNLQLETSLEVCRAQLGWPLAICGNTPDGLRSPNFLAEGRALVSNSRRFRLEVKPTGVIEAFDTTTNSVFWSSTITRRGQGGYRLALTRRGTIEVIDRENTVVWTAARASSHPIDTCLLLQDDRSVVLYSSCGKILWRSNAPSLNRPASRLP